MLNLVKVQFICWVAPPPPKVLIKFYVNLYYCITFVLIILCIIKQSLQSKVVLEEDPKVAENKIQYKSTAF